MSVKGAPADSIRLKRAFVPPMSPTRRGKVTACIDALNSFLLLSSMQRHGRRFASSQRLAPKGNMPKGRKQCSQTTHSILQNQYLQTHEYWRVRPDRHKLHDFGLLGATGAIYVGGGIVPRF